MTQGKKQKLKTPEIGNQNEKVNPKLADSLTGQNLSEEKKPKEDYINTEQINELNEYVKEKYNLEKERYYQNFQELRKEFIKQMGLDNTNRYLNDMLPGMYLATYEDKKTLKLEDKAKKATLYLPMENENVLASYIKNEKNGQLSKTLVISNGINLDNFKKGLTDNNTLVTIKVNGNGSTTITPADNKTLDEERSNVA